MSLFRKVTDQGGVLVVRDEKGEVVTKARPLPAAPKIESWRSQMRRVNNGGMDTLLHIANVARGIPQRSVLPPDENGDVKYSEWVVPTIAEQMSASQFIAEFQLGKAVAQTEVMKAEEASSDQAQYAAMSDEALAEAARPYLERVKKPVLPSGEPEEEE
jgi:hypothetical protein